ncbi:MAG TPA: VanZ family protein [Microlunatus sp.]
MPAPQGKSARDRGHVVLVVLFVVYLVLLTWLVLWKLEIPYVGAGALRQIKVVPFVAAAGGGASAPLEVVVNFLLFVPFGLYLGLLAPGWRRWKVVAVVAGASLLTEVVQYVLSLGSSDVTDLIVNTAGGLAGIGLIALVRRRLRARTVPLMTRVCLVWTVIAVLAVGLFVVSPLRYAPPRDVAIGGTHAVR